jgi:hypothetical protein
LNQNLEASTKQKHNFSPPDTWHIFRTLYLFYTRASEFKNILAASLTLNEICCIPMNETLQNLTYTEHWRKLNRRNMWHTLLSKVGLPSAWPPCPRWRPVHSCSPAEATGSCCRRGWSTCLWCTPAQTHPLPGTATWRGSSGRRPGKAESTCNKHTCAIHVQK